MFVYSNVTGAYELFSQCNDLGRSGFNLTANDRNLFLISQIYHRSGNLDRAEDYVRKSMEISKIRAVGSKRSATFATRCEEAA